MDAAGLPRIRALIKQLDADEFAERERATADLLAIGVGALEPLSAAARSGAPEVRVRAAALLRAIRRHGLAVSFRELGSVADDRIDVERAMVMVAQLVDPAVDGGEVIAELDRIAAAVRRKAGRDTDLRLLPPAQALGLLVGVLRDDIGLRGDEETYDHPDNSAVHRVLTRKKGLPIVLSEIAVAVARRLDLPLVGLGIPGRYMIKYDAGKGAEEDVIVDPYGGWVVVTGAALAREVRWFDPDQHLAPSPRRATVDRMLNNLRSDALAVRDHELARLAAEMQREFASGEDAAEEEAND